MKKIFVLLLVLLAILVTWMQNREAISKTDESKASKHPCDEQGEQGATIKLPGYRIIKGMSFY